MKQYFKQNGVKLRSTFYRRHGGPLINAAEYSFDVALNPVAKVNLDHIENYENLIANTDSKNHVTSRAS